MNNPAHTTIQVHLRADTDLTLHEVPDLSEPAGFFVSLRSGDGVSLLLVGPDAADRLATLVTQARDLMAEAEGRTEVQP